MEVRVLGHVSVLDELGSVRSVGGETRQRVLAALATVYPASVRPETLVSIAWGQEAMNAPQASLRMAVSRLRRVVALANGEESIGRNDYGYFLSKAVSVDAARFERGIVESRSLDDPRLVAQLLNGVIDLWSGTPYSGLDGDPFEAERERLTALYVEAMQRHHEALEYLGRASEGLDRLKELSAQRPFNEGLAASVMRGLYAQGDHAAALEVYQHLRRSLDETLGLEPSPQLRNLEVAILNHADVLAQPADHYQMSDWHMSNSASSMTMDSIAKYQTDGSPDDSMIRSLALRADIGAELGLWEDATNAYRAAIELAISGDAVDVAAELILRLSKIVWDPELSDWVVARIDRLGTAGSPLLAAQLRICRAAGPFRTGAESSAVPDSKSLDADLAFVVNEGDRSAAAWAIARTRDALTGTITVKESVEMSNRALALVDDDTVVRGQLERALFVDLLRAGELGRAGAAMRSAGMTARGPEPAVNLFGRLATRNCWDLAIGRYERVTSGLAEMLQFSGRLTAATFDQVVLGQSYWLAREIGQRDELKAYLDGAIAFAAERPETPLWSAAGSLLATELGETEKAMALVDEVEATFGFATLDPGSHRTAVLSVCAESLSRTHVSGRHELASTIYEQLLSLTDHSVLMGWPTVFAGSIERYRAYAADAAGLVDESMVHLTRARWADRCFPALRVQTLLASWRIAGDERYKVEAERVQAKLRARLIDVDSADAFS